MAIKYDQLISQWATVMLSHEHQISFLFYFFFFFGKEKKRNLVLMIVLAAIMTYSV